MGNIFKTIYSYWKIGWLFLTGRKVDAEDYAASYDTVAPSYDRWTGLMGKNTDKIITPFSSEEIQGDMNILDFCCGTGYITRRILEMYPGKKNLSITGIDVSKGMINRCKADIKDKRVLFDVQDGLSFVKSGKDNSFDRIYCGWALVYFNPAEVLGEINRILKPGGTFSLILNGKGTLRGIEEAFLSVMNRYPGEYEKIMDIRLSLPAGKKGLTQWLAPNFEPLVLDEGEEIVSFDSGENLFNWLSETGAIAGTDKIFKNNSRIKQDLLAEISKVSGISTGEVEEFPVNHRYISGIFRKKERS